MTGQRQSFTLNTEPHQAEVGPHTFLFQPEVYSDDFLDAWSQLRAVTAASATDVLPDPETGLVKPATAEAIRERSKAVTEASKAFISSLMLDDDELAALTEPPDGAAGATVFLATKLPDRVVLELQRWILGVYGLRPTSPSSGSAAPSSTETPGDASTGTSPSGA